MGPKCMFKSSEFRAMANFSRLVKIMSHFVKQQEDAIIYVSLLCLHGVTSRRVRIPAFDTLDVLSTGANGRYLRIVPTRIFVVDELPI